MANLTTTYDIVTAALNHAGELTNGNSPFTTKALEYVNRTYAEIICGGSTFVPELAEPWPWARAQMPGVLALLPAYTAGTVTLTNASTAGTFSAAPGVALGSFAGRFLKVVDRADMYRIATHTAGASAFVLDQAYQDVTGALSFSAIKLDYDLVSGIARLIEPMRIYRIQGFDTAGDGRIEGTSPDQLARIWPLHLLENGAPSHFSILGEASGVTKVRFNRSVGDVTRVEYDYIPFPSDLTLDPNTTPIIPREHRTALAYGATYFLMVDKEDTRADAYFRMTQQKIQAMMLERRREFSSTGRDFARMTPRQDMLYGRPRLRSSSGIEFE